MNEASDLHQYTFSHDGEVFYNRCYVTKIWPHRWKDETWISYKAYKDDRPYTCRADDVDCKIATMSRYKVVVLTEPDFEKAKEILADALIESIASHQKAIDSLQMQLDRLDILEVGKRVEGFWEF